MDSSKTQDRLKAFLDRNRSRVASSLNTESNEGFPLITMSTQPDMDNKANQQTGTAETGSGPLSSRLYSQKEQTNAPVYRNPFGYISDRNTSYAESYNNNPTYEGRFATDFSIEDSPKKPARSTINPAAAGSQTQREAIRNSNEDEERGRRNFSSSPPGREENRAPQNFIESFLANKKKAETKIKENLRSLSKEVQKKPSLHTKNHSAASSFRSPIARKYSESVSEAYDQGPLSARASSRRSVQREPLKIEKKPIKIQKTSKPVQDAVRKKPLALSSLKAKEEKHEFLFEEVQSENNRGNKSVRNTSRSKEPIRQKSLTPRGDRTPERKQQPVQQSKREISQGKSPRKEIFRESSKRLNTMDSNGSNNESKFKKEIKKLIQIIKEEKEQITSEMEAMNKELVKYKTAYKKLKKELQQYKNGPVLKNNREDHFIETTKPKRSEDLYTPFTIDELTKHFDNNLPIQAEEDDVELLSKLNHINLDVENLTAKNMSDFNTPQKDLSQNLITETHSFVLRKNDINCYIIKEMNLASHTFFQDTAKEFEEDGTFKPTVIDLLAAQREIIYFMIKKIEIEEKQRLKTEEQASKMMVQMEKAIKQMDERGSVSRKRESASTTELNKSITSQT